MYLLLLVLGALLTAAGTVLAVSGVSLHDHTTDASIVTPGVVAAVGGLLLIGLGLALRTLGRIEQALAFRPMPRATRPGEAIEGAITAAPSEPARLLPLPKAVPRPANAAIAPSTAPAAATVPQGDVAEKTGDQLEAPAAVKEPEASPKLPLMPASVEGAAEADGAVRRVNGGAAAKPAPRLEMTAPSPLAAERRAGPAFDTLWPKGSRSARPAQAVPVPAPSAPVASPERSSEAVPSPQVAAAEEAPAPVSVLKSGVVDGMAYKLYSDGSIEAQLPQGTLRFGSITELRNHIEQSA